jgi:hypothetical protein
MRSRRGRIKKVEAELDTVVPLLQAIKLRSALQRSELSKAAPASAIRLLHDRARLNVNNQ